MKAYTKIALLLGAVILFVFSKKKMNNRKEKKLRNAEALS